MPIYEHKTDGERATKDGKLGWMLDYRLWNDKRKRVVFYGTKTQAESRLAVLINEQNEIRSGRKTPQSINPIRISELGKKHRNDLLNNKDRSKSTTKRYEDGEKAFRKYLGDKYINEITPEDLNLFKKKRREKDKLTAEGINCDLRSLRALFNYAVAEGYLLPTDNPIEKVEWAYDHGIYRKQRGVRYFTEEEMQKLAEAIRDNGDTDHLELYFMYLFSGARRSEILPATEFRWDNVDFKQKIITFNQQKNRKVRTVTMVPQVEQILKARQKRTPESTYPFDYTGDHVYDILVRKYMRRICGIEGVSVQTLRRTTGAILLKNNWKVYDVSKYLDHASVTTTERHYVDLLQERADGMAEDLGAYIGSLSADENSPDIGQ